MNFCKIGRDLEEVRGSTALNSKGFMATPSTLNFLFFVHFFVKIFFKIETFLNFQSRRHREWSSCRLVYYTMEMNFCEFSPRVARYEIFEDFWLNNHFKWIFFVGFCICYWSMKIWWVFDWRFVGDEFLWIFILRST